jgi:hypothetical protein
MSAFGSFALANVLGGAGPLASGLYGANYPYAGLYSGPGGGSNYGFGGLSIGWPTKDSGVMYVGYGAEPTPGPGGGLRIQRQMGNLGGIGFWQPQIVGTGGSSVIVNQTSHVTGASTYHAGFLTLAPKYFNHLDPTQGSFLRFGVARSQQAVPNPNGETPAPAGQLYENMGLDADVGISLGSTSTLILRFQGGILVGFSVATQSDTAPRGNLLPSPTAGGTGTTGTLGGAYDMVVTPDSFPGAYTTAKYGKTLVNGVNIDEQGFDFTGFLP